MADTHRSALILAGGRGTRFWPRSRTRRAKQVLDFIGTGTLIQQTVERLSLLIPVERIWVLTNPHLQEEIRQQLPQVPPEQILAEPAQRNTAPAIGLAAHILQSLDPDAVMGVFPADHYIEKPEEFVKIVDAAYQVAEQDGIGLIGIQPRWAETGYGYIEFAPGTIQPGSLTPSTVVRFREKPDAATAQQFVNAGHFLWNAGMFFWKASVFLKELSTHLPVTAQLLSTLPSFKDSSFQSKMEEVFPQSENISVDYAVLEKAQGVQGFSAGDIGWNDVGSWNAVYELLDRDSNGNAVRGDAVFQESEGNFIDARGKLVALVGVKDLVIVDTPDALLIADRNQAQKVGDIVKQLEKLKRNDLL